MKNKIVIFFQVKIKKYLNEYLELTKKINPSVLASSLVYYVIIVSIPLINCILFFLAKLRLIELEFHYNLNGIDVVIFIINLFYVTSKITYNLKIISNIIFQKKASLILKERMKSISLLIYLVLMIIGVIIGELCLQFILNIGLVNNIIKTILIFGFRFFMISYIYGFLLKKIIPIEVKIFDMFKTSLFVTFIIYSLIFLYQLFYQLNYPIKYQNLYGSNYQLFLFVVLLYLICLILIHSIIFQFIRYKIKNSSYNNNEHERGVINEKNLS